eukprot:Sdes_comp16323_c0_seq1m5686
MNIPRQSSRETNSPPNPLDEEEPMQVDPQSMKLASTRVAMDAGKAAESLSIDPCDQDLSSFAMPGLGMEEPLRASGPNENMYKLESVRACEYNISKDSTASTSLGNPIIMASPNNGQQVNTNFVSDACNKYCSFLDNCLCYDMLPISGKLVVFDTRLPVKKAFYALLQNDIRSAPLWCSKKQQFIGMLTITDFINILDRYYQKKPDNISELEEHQLASWKEMSEKSPKTIISIDPMCSILESVEALIGNSIHRLPVIDGESGSPISILTHKRILNFLQNNWTEDIPIAFIRYSIHVLGIGTYKNIEKVTYSTPVISVLRLLASKRISAVPVVDDAGVIVDVYAKSDVINLASAGAYNNLDISVKDALLYRAEVGFLSSSSSSVCEVSLILYFLFLFPHP